MVGITVATCVPCGIYAMVCLRDIFREEVLKPWKRWRQIRKRDRKPKDSPCKCEGYNLKMVFIVDQLCTAGSVTDELWFGYGDDNDRGST